MFCFVALGFLTSKCASNDIGDINEGDYEDANGRDVNSWCENRGGDDANDKIIIMEVNLSIIMRMMREKEKISGKKWTRTLK